MSSIHLKMKPPPWRYVLAAAAFVTSLLVLFATYRNHRSRWRNVIPKNTTHGGSPNLLNHISNTTLGFEKILAISLPERTDHRDGLILASAVSDIHVEFVDGVKGATVPEKALPPGKHNQSPSTVGSWRAHLNAVARVVQNNYSSALIVEDDVDWDVRLKSLLKNFAVSTNALASNHSAVELDFHSLPPTTLPQVSPYGDDWDLLWLGHCGMRLSAIGQVVHTNDLSVPEPQYLRSWDKDEKTPLAAYPPHTRVVMRQSEVPVCSLAYAVSQRGARSLLYSLGLQKFDAPYDVMLRAWCQGLDGNDLHVCPGVLPQLFDHHRRPGPKAFDSDISAPNKEFREKAMTLNIRWSVRMNMEKILRGETSYDDQFPDT